MGAFMHKRLFNKILFLLTFFFLALISGRFAQAQESILPKEAQQAMNAGLDAAKKQDWNLAIKHFKEAQGKAPLEPALIFNLALAYDKAGGREFPSLIWYKAYLVLRPGAANAGKVRQRMAELEVKIKADINKFIAKAKEAILLLSTRDAADNCEYILFAQFNIDDLAGMVATARSIRGHAAYKAPSYSLVAEMLTKAGQVEQAKQLAEELRELGEKQDIADGLDVPIWSKKRNAVLMQVLWSQAEGKDFQGAKATIESIQDSALRNLARVTLARFLAESGNIAQAKEIAAQIDKIDYVRQAAAYAIVSEVEAKAADLSGAKNSLELAKTNAGRIKKQDPALNEIYEYITKAQAALGDFNSAQETAKLIKDDRKQNAYYAILKAHLKAGNVVAAKSMLPLTENMPEAYVDIVESQIKMGDIKGAQKTTKTIDNRRYGFLAQSLIAKAEDRPQEAEVLEIYALSSYGGYNDIEDMPNYLRSRDTQKPDAVVRALGNVAKNMGFFLKQLHDIEAKYDSRSLEKKHSLKGCRSDKK
jgi:hypothetical protein